MRPHFGQRSCLHCSTWFDLEAHFPGFKKEPLAQLNREDKRWIHSLLESSMCGQGRLQTRGGTWQSWTNLEAAALQVESRRPATASHASPLCSKPVATRGHQAERRRGGHQLLRCKCCCGSNAFCQVLMSHPLQKAVPLPCQMYCRAAATARKLAGITGCSKT